MAGLAINKRAPEIDGSLHKRYAKISKADWAELYFDLYKQVFGEDVSEDGETIMQDAEKRLETLKRYREI